jgi:hypothetical protein
MSDNYRIVKVKWKDAVNYNNGWMDIKDAKLVCQTSVGLLIKETKKKIVLAMNVNSNNEFSGVTVIPASWLIKIEIIK